MEPEKTTLRPDRTINRAEFLKVLVNATGVDLARPVKPHFPDVQPEHWFYIYIETAKAQGWVNGYPDGTFKPGNEINRAEIAKVLTEAFNLDSPEVADPRWYAKYVLTLNEQGLMPYQVLSQSFNPAHIPTRAEVFEQIFRTIRIGKGLADPHEQNPTSKNLG